MNADPNQLELALLNLAVNARDAMPGEGTITISAMHVEVRQPGADGPASPGPYVRVVVSDTGVGMDEATLARAVEPFFTTKGVGKGTGLGLSMIHGFAVQSGGAMRLTSKVGQGSTVELWLPQGQTPAGAAVGFDQPTSPEPERPPQRPGTVLLVEDDPLVMVGTSAMLEELGHRVLEAASGDAALKILAANAAVDLVITDHAMQGMTGLELADRIQVGWPLVPVLLATGYAELPERVGLNIPRITKPFRQSELGAAVERVLTTVRASDASNVVALRKA